MTSVGENVREQQKEAGDAQRARIVPKCKSSPDLSIPIRRKLSLN